MERNPQIPLILFTWLDPALVSWEVAVIFDDSIWTLAVPAVRLAEQKQPDAKIPSKPLIFSGKIVNNEIMKLLNESAHKTPQEDLSSMKERIDKRASNKYTLLSIMNLERSKK